MDTSFSNSPLLLAMEARRLKHRGQGGLPNLIFMTDEARVRDPTEVIANLPRGTMVIFRDYDAPDREARGRAVVKAARARGHKVLVAADWQMAWRLRADGVHLPERLALPAGQLKMRRPDWIVTAAAHSGQAIRRAENAGADALLVSPVFATKSHAGAQGLGRGGFVKLVAGACLPVFALGGMNGKTARHLRGTRLQGFAAIEGLMR